VHVPPVGGGRNPTGRHSSRLRRGFKWPEHVPCPTVRKCRELSAAPLPQRPPADRAPQLLSCTNHERLKGFVRVIPDFRGPRVLSPAKNPNIHLRRTPGFCAAPPPRFARIEINGTLAYSVRRQVILPTPWGQKHLFAGNLGSGPRRLGVPHSSQLRFERLNRCSSQPAPLRAVSTPM